MTHQTELKKIDLSQIIKNIVGNEEHTGYQHFLLQQHFQNIYHQSR